MTMTGILILTTTNCPKCKMLKMALDEKHIPFSFKNTDTDTEGLALSQFFGVTSAPAVLYGTDINDYELIEWDTIPNLVDKLAKL